MTIVVTGVTERNCHRDGLQLRKRAGGLYRRAGDREPEHPSCGAWRARWPRSPAEDLRITVDLSRYHGAGGPYGAGDGRRSANYANVGVKGSYQIVVDVERLP